jgi:hypothetical protein
MSSISSLGTLAMTLLLVFPACDRRSSEPQRPPQDVNQAYPELLDTEWVHSWEEDKDGAKVYRSEGYSFPASEPRDGLKFERDGRFVEYNPAPNDAGTVPTYGRWEAMDKNEFLIKLNTGNLPVYRLRILGMSSGLLRVSTGR